MRLIDADELLEHKYAGVEYDRAIDDGIKKTDDAIFAFKCGWNDALQSVADFAPTIDAEPIRHGHWIFLMECVSYGKTHRVLKCSECGYERSMMSTQENPKYCEECGAKMDEVTE